MFKTHQTFLNEFYALLNVDKTDNEIFDEELEEKEKALKTEYNQFQDSIKPTVFISKSVGFMK